MNVLNETKRVLRQAFASQTGIDIHKIIRDGGKAGTICENLISHRVKLEDFADEVFRSKGNARKQFRAIHSSAALVVNCFAPFRKKISDLQILKFNNFDSLNFEKELKTNEKDKRPQPDVLLQGENCVIAIESKLTEYFTKESLKFEGSYEELKNIGYYDVMQTVKDENFKKLNAIQMINHSFGIDSIRNKRNKFLIYLYWEPANVNQLDSSKSKIFETHWKEICRFKQIVSGLSPKFIACSYNKLWENWRTDKSISPWVREHVKNLQDRYAISLYSD